MKPCPKCDVPLVTRKDGSKFCVNGCEVYTAMPHGSLYHDQTIIPATDKNGNRVTGGGANNMRRVPRFEE